MSRFQKLAGSAIVALASAGAMGSGPATSSRVPSEVHPAPSDQLVSFGAAAAGSGGGSIPAYPDQGSGVGSNISIPAYQDQGSGGGFSTAAYMATLAQESGGGSPLATLADQGSGRGYPYMQSPGVGGSNGNAALLGIALTYMTLVATTLMADSEATDAENALRASQERRERESEAQAAEDDEVNGAIETVNILAGKQHRRRRDQPVRVRRA